MSVYQSILEKRTSDVKPEEIDSCQGLSVRATDMIDAPGRSAKLWNYHSPYAPEDIRQLLTAGYGRTVRVAMELDAPPLCASNVSLSFEGSNSSFSRFTYYASMCPHMTGTHINLPERMRGQGLGKHYMRNSIEYEIAMDAEVKRFNAGLGNGGYTWTSMGAQVDMGNWDNLGSLRKRTSLQIDCKLSLIRDHLLADHYDGLKELGQIKRADDLVRLVDEFRDVSLPFDIHKDFQGLSESAVAPFVEEFHERHQTFKGAEEREGEAIINEVALMDASFRWASEQGHNGVSVPRFLLAGTVYPARIEYNNAAIMNRIGNYLGGWKTIRPVDDRPEVKHTAIPALV